jgi:ParB-like chromosome segregation protein Spo0J
MLSNVESRSRNRLKPFRCRSCSLSAVSPELKQSVKYKQIAKSVAEVGIIEPHVVARSPEQPRHYLLLDGHIRHAVLADAGETEVRCLIALDDEAFRQAADQAISEIVRF